MKINSITIKLSFLLLFFVAGCGKDYLEPNKELTLSVPEYYETLDESTIAGITGNMYGRDWFNYLDKAAACLQELYCGNGVTDDGAYMPFFNGTLNSAFNQLDFLWTTNYGIIKNCNLSINGFSEAMAEGQKFKAKVDASESLKISVNTTIGELRFFRALCYFNLVRWFGSVPLVYDNLYQMANRNTLAPVAEEDLYEFIIRDLNIAIEKLPATRNASKSNALSSISAKALLAKVYLTKAGMPFGTASDFTQAANISNEIITNPGGYSLTETYHENFLPKYSLDNFPTECLWGWKWSWTALFTTYGTQNTLQSYFGSSHFTQSWDGWTAVKPSVDLRESYETGDLRRYSTVMENGDKYPEFWTQYTFPGQTTPGYVYFDGSVSGGNPSATAMHIRKHLAGRDNSGDGHIGEMHTEVYTPMIRLSDVYLTYAEAILAKNASTSDGTALARFNVIRQRAGLQPLTTITYRNIWNERRHEFAFEFQNTDDLFRYYRLYPQDVKTMIMNQKRGTYTMETAPYSINGTAQSFPAGQALKVVTSKTYNDFRLPSVTDDYFKLPYPMSEVNGNPLLKDAPVRFNFDLYQ
jgi:hypothetical protein